MQVPTAVDRMPFGVCRNRNLFSRMAEHQASGIKSQTNSKHQAAKDLKSRAAGVSHHAFLNLDFSACL
jgi:hypothetical protein